MAADRCKGLEEWKWRVKEWGRKWGEVAFLSVTPWMIEAPDNKAWAFDFGAEEEEEEEGRADKEDSREASDEGEWKGALWEVMAAKAGLVSLKFLRVAMEVRKDGDCEVLLRWWVIDLYCIVGRILQWPLFSEMKNRRSVPAEAGRMFPRVKGFSPFIYFPPLFNKKNLIYCKVLPFPKYSLRS